MNDQHTREALETETTAFRRLLNPVATAATTSSATKAFRMPIVVRHLTIDPVPTDERGAVLPYVVLLDVQRGVDVATWPDVVKDNTRSLPDGTDISPCWLIATRSKADWDAVRPAILNGGGNGEPGTATNGTGTP